MLQDAEYADVTIYVGNAKEPFHLHRSIICETSGFFKAAYKPGLSKGGTKKKIELPSIDPLVFRRVVQWQYQQGYEARWTVGFGDYLMFQAADFLKIQDLRDEVLKNLQTSCQRRDTLCGSSQDGVKKFVDNFAKICGLACKSDFPNLIPIAKKVGTHWKIKAGGVLGSLDSEVYGSIFVAVMLEALAIQCRPCDGCSDDDSSEHDPKRKVRRVC
ncbi:hypothetical protein TWF788_011231 [Orbilia oligospora]|nr:hypothetical protein TWF788_011231 [Orbilia oligospora]